MTFNISQRTSPQLDTKWARDGGVHTSDRLQCCFSLTQRPAPYGLLGTGDPGRPP